MQHTKYLQTRTLFSPQIVSPPASNLGLVVVIPCYDEPNALASLRAIQENQLPIEVGVEVILVINSGEQSNETAKQQNAKTLTEVSDWIKEQAGRDNISWQVLYHPNLPKKHAGVGLARKIGMDEAVYRLEKVGNPKGVILCFDADASCANNYLVEVVRHFNTHPKTPACSIYFEHPLEGEAYDADTYKAIAQYELFLRYYVHALRYAGHPHAYQTIGSSMAVRADAYQQQGGMNRRQAGEDFYFLQKFIPLGHFTEITTTSVFPSPRPSHRVPFGTGKAVGEICQSPDQVYTTYEPQTFKDLKQFLIQIDQWYAVTEIQQVLENLPLSIQTYLQQQEVVNKIQEIKQNTSSLKSYKQRFYRWFNAFQALKFVHFARDHYYPNIPINEAATQLLQMRWNIQTTTQDATNLLPIYRSLDKKNLPPPSIPPSFHPSTPQSLSHPIIKYTNATAHTLHDQVAIEAPLEIRIRYGTAQERKQTSIAITMRTPGDDKELAMGFLFTEGLIQSKEEVQYCHQADENEIGQQVTVELQPSLTLDLEKLKRHFYVSSSCGVCGKAAIEAVHAIHQQYKLLVNQPCFSTQQIHQLPQLLRKEQEIFEATGGLHAAALFNASNELLILKEDVGRHNALDKLIGAALQRNLLPLSNMLLLVSGRVSFELVQKATAAGIPILAAVGAPSSLAIELAESVGMTLLGFVRNQRFNLYTHKSRICP